jgi:hypothetical protein
MSDRWRGGLPQMTLFSFHISEDVEELGSPGVGNSEHDKHQFPTEHH